MGKSLFTGRLRMTLVFAFHIIAPVISESLLGNIPVNGNSPKVPGYFSLYDIYAISFLLYLKAFCTSKTEFQFLKL